MNTPDRNEELVRAMLERRSGGTTPDWLLGATMQQVVRSRQSRRRGPSIIPTDDSARMAVIVAAVALLALAAAVAAGALLQRTTDPLDPPVAVVQESVTSSPADAASPEASGGEDADPRSPATATDDAPINDPDDVPVGSPEAGSTQRPPDDPEYPNGIDVESPVGIGMLALVTNEGDRLRVRSRPGLGEDSERLSPLLPANTNVFVFDGPVTKDGYDWYHVAAYGADRRLYGWVAGGDDQDMWLQTSEPVCGREPTRDEVIERPAAEFLVCYGEQPITVTARVNDGLGPLSEGGTEADYACPDLASADGCALGEPWLQVPLGSILFQFDDLESTVEVALPPGQDSRFFEAPLGEDVQFTIALDAPEASACAVIDTRTGENHITPEEARARCRLTYVLVDIDW